MSASEKGGERQELPCGVWSGCGEGGLEEGGEVEEVEKVELV